MKGWLQPNASSFAVLIVTWLQLPQLIARQGKEQQASIITEFFSPPEFL